MIESTFKCSSGDDKENLKFNFFYRYDQKKKKANVKVLEKIQNFIQTSCVDVFL